MTEEIEYNRAHVWQIGFFSLNNAAVNLYWMLLSYISYYAAGVLGLGVALTSGIILAMNILDACTDPIAAWFVDKTQGRFGKFRPFMVLGNMIMIGAMVLLYFAGSLPAFRAAAFTSCYVLYVFGYTFQYCITRAAQTVLTNDPKQRPILSMFDMVINILLYVGIAMLVSNYLIPKHGDFNHSMFGEFFLITCALSLVCTVLAVIGIWSKDRPEFYGNVRLAQPKINWSDFLDVLRHNRNVRSLVISAGTDELFSSVTTNATVVVIVYGIICGNYELSGKMSMYVFMPSLIIAMIVIGMARKIGQKKAFLIGTYGAIIANFVIFISFIIFDPTTLSFSTWGVFTIVLTAGIAVRGGFMSVLNSIALPMCADCSDDELLRSGKYIPTMIGSIFSFMDKIMASLNGVVVAALVIAIGFKEAYPTVNTPGSPQLFWVGIIAFCGMPFISWIINLICMHHYTLDKKGMEEIQIKLAETKKG
ncbi:MAG: MFS transporter [Anaerovoracaceae bacterium]|jgi:GPH family glycoside/pentoside/hexuronide:cation symporter